MFFFLRNQNDIYNQKTILPTQDVLEKKARNYNSMSISKNHELVNTRT